MEAISLCPWFAADDIREERPATPKKPRIDSVGSMPTPD